MTFFNVGKRQQKHPLSNVFGHVSKKQFYCDKYLGSLLMCILFSQEHLNWDSPLKI